jgi:murein DD-endopeptidase MepM/ murein hydrolase activator NlpD
MRLIPTRFLLIAISIITLLFMAGTWGVYRYALSADQPTSTPIPPPLSKEEEEIKKAIDIAIQAEQPHALALLLYENQIEEIKTSADGSWATAWLVPLDPQTGEIVPIEPGLALVRSTDQGWQAFLPSDPLWPIVIKEIPNDLIPSDKKIEWLQLSEYKAAAVTAPIKGYKLPWSGGDTMALTQSVGHDRYTPSGNAHFAFDFAKPGYPSGLFNVLAARGGVVRRVIWTNENGNETNSNYIVLEDTSTSPVTYQLYMHLAKDSIPPELRVIGKPVRQGQLIGVADDTGVSSGNHLHFMVHTNAASYWGTSIDITFDEVTINGGRPRITSDLPYCKSSDVCDTTQTTYVSSNFMSPDHIPPTGGITLPPQGSLISIGTLPLQGWAKDENSGIGSVQFMALYSGAWHYLGNTFSSENFSYNWDMCADKVPDGPVSLALSIRDKALNQATGLPGLTHFSKNYECPVPPTACNPTSNQIALFAGSDYQGKCEVFSTGDYSSASQLGKLGGDNAESIRVGANVQATLFTGESLTGRGETFFGGDSNLADNRVGADTVSSLKVKTRTSLPAIPALTWPENGASYLDDASFSFSWRDASGGSQYQLQVISETTSILVTPWISQTHWHLSALPPGDYTWKVKARNENGESSWSTSRTLQITPASNSLALLVEPLVPPFLETMESATIGWEGTNWKLANEANHTDGGSLGWEYSPNSSNSYDDGTTNSGYLTSPEITIPGSGAYYLRFYYQYETEDPHIHWDQRWVQISVNGGAYENMLQLSSDPMSYWLRSPAISLVSYLGQKIRLRFYFSTLDSLNNQFMGWNIDDVSITTEPPSACIDSDNTIAQASWLLDAQPVTRAICPGGDIDYYKFQGVEGDQIGIRTQSQAIGSPLDTTLTLIDIDGSSPLAYNDDIVQFERTDSFISYRLSRSGTFYIKVQAWDHPNSGGMNEVYTLALFSDSQDPSASFINPQEATTLSFGKTNLSIAASDNKSGIGLIRFYWHSNDWQIPNWIYLGEDWDPSDGWNYEFDTSGISNLNGIAVYAVVFDWAGNWVGTGAWNLRSPMIYLPLIIQSH